MMNRIGGMCLNWKVVVGLAAIGLGVFLFAPSLLNAALPLLLVAACPLSMILMMATMGKVGGNAESHCSTQSSSRQTVASSREATLAELRRELADLSTRQVEIAAQLRALEDPERASPQVMH